MQQSIPTQPSLLALFILSFGLVPMSVSASKLPDIRSGSPEGLPVIPREYRGRWCAKAGADGPTKDLSEIRISPHKLHIYGEDQHVQRVSKRAGQALIVLFVDEAEGTIFDSEKQFSLSEDRNELRLRSEDEDDTSLFTRCPR